MNFELDSSAQPTKLRMTHLFVATHRECNHLPHTESAMASDLRTTRNRHERLKHIATASSGY
jgi:hypothetical protein